MVDPVSARHGPDAPLVAGDLVDGKYRVEGMLGEGAMGAIYAARHEMIGHAVALKVLRSEVLKNDEMLARFLGEARMVAHLANDHVARVIDAGHDGQRDAPFIVMERLVGTDLDALLGRDGALPASQAVGYLLQALEALAEAHALGIVHRDLKPANVFLARMDDGSEIVKVLDFGVSKFSNLAGLGGDAVATSARQVLGTPAYMSPEQLKSSKHVDARSDIWSAGVLLFEMLSGQLPFAAQSVGELFHIVFAAETPPRRSLGPHLPPALDSVIARCLKRTPQNRFANVAELAAELLPFVPSDIGAASLQRIEQLLRRAPPQLNPVPPMPVVRRRVHAAIAREEHERPAAYVRPAAPLMAPPPAKARPRPPAASGNGALRIVVIVSVLFALAALAVIVNVILSRGGR